MAFIMFKRLAGGLFTSPSRKLWRLVAATASITRGSSRRNLSGGDKVTLTW
jgi:hypothetical protein